MRDFSGEPENPKLVEMHRLLMTEVGYNEDARVIIFVKSRELARALIKWMHETVQLKPLNATEFVGQVASASKGGDIIQLYLKIFFKVNKLCMAVS